MSSAVQRDFIINYEIISQLLLFNIRIKKYNNYFNKSSWTTLTKQDKKLMQDENHAATGVYNYTLPLATTSQ